MLFFAPAKIRRQRDKINSEAIQPDARRKGNRLINLVFSIDSIVTAVGMANEIWVMAVAVIASMVVLIAAAGPVGKFVDRHPTVKVLALGFLIMIGMTFVADAFGVHIPKGYVYSAMIFSVLVEGVNMMHRRKTKPVHLHNQYGPGAAIVDSEEYARSGLVPQTREQANEA